jgi:hypothetical protein
MEALEPLTEPVRRFADIDAVAPKGGPGKGREAEKRIRQLVGQLRDAEQQLELATARIELLESELDVVRFKLAIAEEQLCRMKQHK